jgi:hypothetical protein
VGTGGESSHQPQCLQVASGFFSLEAIILQETDNARKDFLKYFPLTDHLIDKTDPMTTLGLLVVKLP